MRPTQMGHAPAQPGRPNLSDPPVTGCLAGTRVLCQDGEIPVEFLTPGDRIITREDGYATLRALRSRQVIARAVHVTAGALGPERPGADLILPADQPLFLRGPAAMARAGRAQVLLRAGALAGEDGVRDLGLKRMELFTLEFDRRQVIYAGGLEMSGSVPIPGSAASRAA